MTVPASRPPSLDPPACGAADVTSGARATLVAGACAAGSQIAVGSSVAASSIVKSYPVLTGQALRYALASVLLVAVARRLPRIDRRDLARVVLLAVVGLAGFNVCLIGAVRLGDAGSVGVIVGGVPVVLALCAPALRRQAPSQAVVGAAAVVFVGAAAVQWTGDKLPADALALAVGALLCEAGFSLLALPLLPRLGAVGVSVYACLAAAAILAVAAGVSDGAGALPTPTVEEALALVGLAALVTALAFVLWYSSLQRLGVERAGLFAGLIPVAALISTALVGESSLTALRVAGALLVGTGVAVGVRASARAASTREIVADEQAKEGCR